ncbi:hypothetical protein [Salipaludibacillus daqingensis]|uniref:hypothetical protein n=1 Tax=Salipaludibacillus daqingensis TaxID=3041001 RepID=UPI00247534A3|nr:hypothetical protein [Salipaludibacillus daqingensis]
MSMPNVPKQPYRPDLDQTVIDLLESIALEEIALSHLLNAEAEKIQTYLCKFLKCEHTNHKELISFNKTVNSTLSTIVMKEFLLLRKLETTLQITDDKEKPEKDKKPKPPKKKCPPPCPPGCNCEHCKEA